MAVSLSKMEATWGRVDLVKVVCPWTCEMTMKNRDSVRKGWIYDSEIQERCWGVIELPMMH